MNKPNKERSPSRMDELFKIGLVLLVAAIIVVVVIWALGPAVGNVFSSNLLAV